MYFTSFWASICGCCIKCKFIFPPSLTSVRFIKAEVLCPVDSKSQVFVKEEYDRNVIAICGIAKKTQYPLDNIGGLACVFALQPALA